MVVVEGWLTMDHRWLIYRLEVTLVNGRHGDRHGDPVT